MHTTCSIVRSLSNQKAYFESWQIREMKKSALINEFILLGVQHAADYGVHCLRHQDEEGPREL